MKPEARAAPRLRRSRCRSPRRSTATCCGGSTTSSAAPSTSTVSPIAPAGTAASPPRRDAPGEHAGGSTVRDRGGRPRVRVRVRTSRSGRRARTNTSREQILDAGYAAGFDSAASSGSIRRRGSRSPDSAFRVITLRVSFFPDYRDCMMTACIRDAARHRGVHVRRSARRRAPSGSLRRVLPAGRSAQILSSGPSGTRTGPTPTRRARRRTSPT